jgi:hypothetical protein
MTDSVRAIQHGFEGDDYDRGGEYRTLRFWIASLTRIFATYSCSA